MKQGIIETIVGFLVIIIAAVFFVFAYKISDSSKLNDGYDIVANFENIEGISEGSDIKIAGIKIGHVKNITIDMNNYYAVVDIFIKKDVPIPVDSRAVITTSGLLGGKYINISPGASEYFLVEGGNIVFTQSSLNIEDLVSKLIYSLTK